MGIGVIALQTTQKEEQFVPTVTTANTGLSMTGTAVRLGQVTSTAGDPALISVDREIPFVPGASLVLSYNSIPVADVATRLDANQLLMTGRASAGSVPIITLTDLDNDQLNIHRDPALGWTIDASTNLTIGMPTYIGDGNFLGNLDAQVMVAPGIAARGQMRLFSGTLAAGGAIKQGLLENNGTNLSFVRSGVTRENVFTGNSGAAAPGTTAGVAIVNFYGTAATNYLGDPNSWASVVLSGTTFKIPLYT